MTQEKRSWFVDTTQVVRYDLSDGNWVELKAQLTFGERQSLEGGALAHTVNEKGQTEVRVDWERYQVHRMQVWIVDWSARDEKDKPVRLTRAALENLAPPIAAEILAIIDRHTEEVLGKELTMRTKKETQRPGELSTS